MVVLCVSAYTRCWRVFGIDLRYFKATTFDNQKIIFGLFRSIIFPPIKITNTIFSNLIKFLMILKILLTLITLYLQHIRVLTFTHTSIGPVIN